MPQNQLSMMPWKPKEAEINSRIDLTDEEKAAAKADAKAKADEAKKNIDAATTNATVRVLKQVELLI